MKDFFPIETPYDSEDYKLMKSVINKDTDSNSSGFVKSEFRKSPNFNNKFLWNIHESELPILYKRLEELYNETGNSDYESLLNDIQNVADNLKTAISDELDEMIDPYDPMDLNQTITGEPTDTSDLANGGVDNAPAYSEEPTMKNQGIENYIDDDTIGQELTMEISESELKDMIRLRLECMTGENPETSGVEYNKEDSELPEIEENSSDSLANQHGMNAKPQTTISEITDTEKYEDVIFLQGENAEEAMDILNNDGKEAALEYLKQWHYPGEHMGRNELPHGTQDKTFVKDGYIMAWNPYLPYIGLTFDTSYVSDLDEDSQTIRHRADQRQKTVPIGQHAPHSQVAKK